MAAPLALDPAPDLIMYNASLHPVLPLAEGGAPPLRALAVRKHRILAMGSDEELLALAGPHTRRLDAEGATLLPGFTDSHIHFTDWAHTLSALQIADTTSLADMCARLAERAAATPEGGWIVARGWNEARWGVDSFPTAADLDGATGPARPTLLYRSDMHCAVANSAALVAAGIGPATPDPALGVIDRDGQGRPTGILREAAIDVVAAHVPPPTSAQLLEAMRAGMRLLHRYGITAIHDQRVWSGDEGPQALRHFQQLRAAGELTLRVACNVAYHHLDKVAGAGLTSGMGDDFLRLGHVKLFADGSLGSRTAWMLAPFEPVSAGDPPNCGVVVTAPDEMRDAFRRSVAAGFPVSIHAIGDRANREAIDAFADLALAMPGHRDALGAPLAAPHRIEHVQMIDPADIPRLARLNLTASVQPMHALDDMEIADALLGGRAATAYTFRALRDAGVRLAFGSDAPVATPNPWLGLHAAVARSRPGGAPWFGEQRLPLEAALHAYTAGAAAAAGWDRRFGRLVPGARADLLLANRDLFALTAEEIEAGALADCFARLTLFNGEVVWEA
jgi:predicted amidohydrolase YtcJ